MARTSLMLSLPAKVSDMKADDNFIRKLDLSMYYRYHQMRRDNYKNKE